MTGQKRGIKKSVGTFIVGVFFAFSFLHVAGAALNRPYDPVVIAGSNITAFIGVAPTNIVCFSFTNQWRQIPVQVDERLDVSFYQLYNAEIPLLSPNIKTLGYADTNTFTGADTNTLFDGDDEIAFMAFDAGKRAPANVALPAGVVVNSGVEIVLSDSLNASSGYVYLFESTGTLSQAAGTNYVDYTFTLLSGNYKDNYDLTGHGTGNPETSIVTSSCYSTEFSDRWLREIEHIYVGGSDGMDLLDRHRVSLPGNTPARNEDTFDAGEGAFIVNINGPVRGIRSFIGCNSGPASQRRHYFYKQRQDITTFLRVHQGITGPRDTYNYIPAATNMTYYNNYNTNGFAINGSADSVVSNCPDWEMVNGTHGTLIFTHLVDTDIPAFNQTNYYNDNSADSPPTGTNNCFGMHGPWVDMSNLPNTDPLLSGPSITETNRLETTRIINYMGTNATIGTATTLYAQILSPLQVSTNRFLGDSDADGMADAWELKYFSNLTHSASADDDVPAGDRVENLWEYTAGTDPLDPNSFPAVACSNNTSDITVSFLARQADGAGYSGMTRLYTLEMATSLNGGVWTNISGYSAIAATNQYIIYTNDPNEELLYYRTKIWFQCYQC